MRLIHKLHHSGKATASEYSIFNVRINDVTLGRLSSLCAENAGEALRAIERNPGKLSAVIIEESRSQTYTPSGSNICERGVMIRTVEIVDLPCCDQPVLDSLQCRRRAAANHQSPSIQIFFGDQVFGSERIVPLRDQIDMAVKEQRGALAESKRNDLRPPE